MEDSLKITQLAVYNPQRLDDKTFNALFVARAKVFKYLISNIKDEKPNSIPQHHLIVAARGMGKSMLLKRIETELKSPDLNKIFVPILYPEEQYNISNLNDLWLNSLDRLADIMDTEGNEALVDEIDKKVETFQKELKQNNGKNEAFHYFVSLTKRLKRRPVLLIDNINFIFERLSNDQQHQLRNLLIQNASPIVVAASPVKVEKVLEYGAPFYDAFLITHLGKLDDNELLLILNNLAKLTGSKKISSEIKKHLSRLRAINQLTGGNPRTTVMLFKLITRGFSDSIINDLDALLDDITPLYKARFEEELSDQLQQIMNAIAINWDPLGIKKISKLTGLINSKLSPQLLRLVKSGWIIKKPGYKAQGKVYEVSERFFNIWYLMRQSSRRHKKQVGYLSKFLVSLYGDNIKTGAKNLLACKIEKADHFIYNLAIADSLSDKELRKQLIDKCRKDLDSQKYLDINQKSQIEAILKQFEESEEITKEGIKIIAKVDNSFALFFEANKSEKDGKYEETVKKYGNYLIANPNDTAALYNLGNLYQTHLKRYEESEQCYKKALEINPKFTYALNNLGYLYHVHLKRYKESEQCYKKALEIDPKFTYALNGFGNLYQNYLKRHKKSEQYYKKALEIDPKFTYALNGLGNLYQDHFKRYEESEQYYKKALEIDPNFTYALNGLGNLYQDHFKRYEESEQCYKKALEINPKHTDALINLGNLYKGHFNRYEEAEKCYKKALEINPKYIDALNNLGNLYQDNFNRYEEAEQLYRKVLEIEPEEIAVINNLVFLLRDKTNRIDEAKDLFWSIQEFEEAKDSYYLNFSLFHLYENNTGLAAKKLEKALESIDKEFLNETQDDWWRFAAITHKLGFGQWLLEILEKKGYNKILAPYYEAIKALTIDKPGYLGSKAVEIRNAAEIVLEKIKAYL